MPQEAVKFVFPTEESAFGSLETLIEQGLEEDSILEGQRDAKVGAIVDELQDKRYSLIVVNGLKNALKEFDANGDIVVFAEAVSKVNKEYGYHNYLTNVVMDYEEDGDADWFVSRIRNVVGEANEDYAPYTAGGVRYSIVTDQIEHLFNEAVAGNLTGKPIAIGVLTQEGKDYLEKLSGLKFKDKVSFTLNPSDLVHIHNDHFGGNEKDKGNNIPLTTLDIKRIVDVISFPTAIMYGKERNSGRNLFYFLMDTGAGTYNLLEVYSDRKGNLSTKTYYKTKKDAAQRVMELKSSLLPTSETYSGAILSDTKIPQIFELPKGSAKFSLISPEMDAAYLSAVERGDMATAQQMVMEAAKLAMPNTKVVDDNGNVIPLSERFSPEKEDIRYSLSDRPTGLLTDFAEEFEALQKMYESLDPTTIHTQHPFRIQKRKVVQKYLNYVSQVLGNNVVNIVYDKTNNAHIKKVYDRIVAVDDTFKDDVSFIEFKKHLQSQPVGGAFIKGTNIIIFNISTDNLNNSQADILNSYVHENVHRIIEKLGIDNNTLEDILEEGLRLLPARTNSYIDDYQSRPKYEQGEETLAYSIGNRMSHSQIGMRLLRMIEGYITFEELNATQKKLLPLRDSYIEKILNELQNEYKARKEGADSTPESANRGGVNGEGKGEAKQVYDRRWRGYSATNGYTRRGVLDEERFSLPDMPFFEDGGDVVVFDDIAEVPIPLKISAGFSRATNHYNIGSPLLCE